MAVIARGRKIDAADIARERGRSDSGRPGEGERRQISGPEVPGRHLVKGDGIAQHPGRLGNVVTGEEIAGRSCF